MLLFVTYLNLRFLQYAIVVAMRAFGPNKCHLTELDDTRRPERKPRSSEKIPSAKFLLARRTFRSTQAISAFIVLEVPRENCEVEKGKKSFGPRTS